MALRRAFLSVALLFQLAIVLIGPNKETYHGFLLQPVLEPVFNIFEFGSNWSFFAPDPGPSPIRLEWEILDARGGVLRSDFFPKEGYPYWINERQTRRVSLARFFYFSDERHLSVWGDWICRSNPDAKGVRLWKAIGTLPNLFDVRTGEKTIASGADYGERASVGNVFCDESSRGGKNR
jgi:hypothetical protein